MASSDNPVAHLDGPTFTLPDPVEERLCLLANVASALDLRSIDSARSVLSCGIVCRDSITCELPRLVAIQFPRSHRPFVIRPTVNPALSHPS